MTTAPPLSAFVTMMSSRFFTSFNESISPFVRLLRVCGWQLFVVVVEFMSPFTDSMKDLTEWCISFGNQFLFDLGL